MKRITSAILFLILLSPSLRAQVNSSVFYSNDHNIELAATFPSLLGLDRARMQMDLLGYYAYINSTAFSFNYLRQFISSNLLQNSDINRISNGLSSKNRLYMGSSFRPIELYFKIGKNLTLGAGGKLRTDLRFSFDGKLPEVLWKGNAAYAGETINLLRMDGLIESPVELYAAAALSIPNWENISIRAGIRPKVLISYGAFQIEDSKVDLFTEENGSYFDLDYQFRANMAFPGDTLPNRFGPAMQAYTLGIDLGASVILNKTYYFSASLLDVGKMQYSMNVRNYNGSGSLRYEGIEISDLSGNLNINDSTLTASLDYNSTRESFSTPLPSRLAIQAMYRIARKKINGREYHLFSAGITLIQGLNARSTFGSQTFVSLGAHVNPGGFFNVGANINSYNLKQWGLGANASFRLFAFRFGVGSSNIFAFTGNEPGSYGDLMISGGLNF